MYKTDNKGLKDHLKILAPALCSIWNEFQNHTQMTGNLNVYYLVRDKNNFINNSNRLSLDFAMYYLYHFCYKEHMTWIICSQNALILYEYKYLDHTYSPQPDQYRFWGNIKKKSKFVFFRIYRLREIFFAR